MRSWSVSMSTENGTASGPSPAATACPPARLLPSLSPDGWLWFLGRTSSANLGTSLFLVPAVGVVAGIITGDRPASVELVWMATALVGIAIIGLRGVSALIRGATDRLTCALFRIEPRTTGRTVPGQRPGSQPVPIRLPGSPAQLSARWLAAGGRRLPFQTLVRIGHLGRINALVGAF